MLHFALVIGGAIEFWNFCDLKANLVRTRRANEVDTASCRVIAFAMQFGNCLRGFSIFGYESYLDPRSMPLSNLPNRPLGGHVTDHRAENAP